jgi:tRNA_anti-like
MHMIRFACPGCGCPHSANAVFAGLAAKCIRCGVSLRVPGGAAPKPVAASPAPSPAHETHPDEPHPHGTAALRPVPDMDLDDLLVLRDEVREEEEAEPREERKRERRERTGRDEPPPPAPAAEDAVAPLAADPAPRSLFKRRNLPYAVGGLAVVAIGVAVYFLAFSKPKPPPPPAPAPAPKKEEPPPPKKEEPKKVEPKKEEPKKEEPPLAGQFTAARLIAERDEDPAAFDRKFAGRIVIVEGTYASGSRTSFALCNSQEVERNVIYCEWPKPAPAPPPKSPPAGTLAPGATAPKTPEPPPGPKIQPGQPVTIRGLCWGGLRFSDCTVVRVGTTADDLYKDKDLEVIGMVGPQNISADDAVDTSTLVFEPPTTDCPVGIRSYFRPSQQQEVAKLKPGQAVTVRGRCAGRSYRSVRLDNCVIVAPSAPADPGFTRVRADQLFATYETDLLTFDRPNTSTPPVAVAAEQLAGAFQDNPKQANLTYRYRPVKVTGRVLQRRTSDRAITFEVGTEQRCQIVAVFTPTKFAALRGDEKDLTVRGVCAGVAAGGVIIRVENAELVETTVPDDPTTPRTTAEFLPFQPGRELHYDMLSPGKAKDNPIQRLTVRFAEPDLIRATPVRAGVLPGATLFADPPLKPKWTRDLTKQKTPPPPGVSQYRVNEGAIEMREVPAPPAQPSLWWDPVLKIGVKKGESWSSEMPGGRTVTYTVVGFGKDEAKRSTVEIRRVVKDPKVMTYWEESTIVYAHSVGPVRRTLATRNENGQAVVIAEMRLVEGEDATLETPKQP